jgi:hypothetical protein
MCTRSPGAVLLMTHEDVPTQERAVRRKKNLKVQFQCPAIEGGLCSRAIRLPAKTHTTRAIHAIVCAFLFTLGLFPLLALQFLDTSHLETAAETIEVLPEYRAVLSPIVVRTCLNVKHALFKMSLDNVRKPVLEQNDLPQHVIR